MARRDKVRKSPRLIGLPDSTCDFTFCRNSLSSEGTPSFLKIVFISSIVCLCDAGILSFIKFIRSSTCFCSSSLSWLHLSLDSFGPPFPPPEGPGDEPDAPALLFWPSLSFGGFGSPGLTVAYDLTRRALLRRDANCGCDRYKYSGLER